MSVNFPAFVRTATAELLACGIEHQILRDDKEWWIKFTEPDPPVYGLPPRPNPMIINIPVRREMLDDRSDVAGFVAQALAMAKEEFEAAKIGRLIDKNQGTSPC